MSIELTFWQYFTLGLFGFIAAWVDSIAGGGGIITIPAYLWMGLPPQYALGTNKLSASFSSITSSIRYFFSKNMNLSLVLILAPFTFIGSVIGVKTILSFDSSVVNVILSFSILGVGLYSIFHPSLGKQDSSSHTLPKYSFYFGIPFAFLLGFYDGFFGPGTGSFLMFMFMKIFHSDYLHSCANARFLNFISNITSLVTFILHGKVIFLIGIPIGICMIGGAWLGSHMAIKNGNKIVKPIFIAVTIAVAIKLILDLF